MAAPDSSSSHALPTTSAPLAAHLSATISYADLWSYATACLVKAGSSEENAKTVAKVLVEADLRGITSHGVNRLGEERRGAVLEEIEKRQKGEEQEDNV